MTENLSKSLILVAEDDGIARSIIVKTLENIGYQVVSAANGQQAIDICYAEHPQVILMDAVMPGVDGFEACRQIKHASEESIRSIPVIIVTALEGDDEAIDKAFAAGAEDYISKPVNWHILEHRLDVLAKKFQAEQSLRLSEERYGNIFENSLTEIFVFDANTYKFIKVNRGACKNISYTPEELSELTLLDIQPELTVERFDTLVEPIRTGTQEIQRS